MEPFLNLDTSHACGLDLDGIAGDLHALPAWAHAERAEGRLDFLDLPLDTEVADAITSWVENAPAATDVVVCGIGGSALSARIFEALRDPYEQGPRLHVLDTVDPAVIEHRLRTLDPSATVVLAISKSGGTLETAAGFLLFEAWMREHLADEAATRVAVVAGEERNPLRARAEERGYVCFPVPAGVGGRYSGLTAAGLLPAACVGVEPRRLLAGAAAARECALLPTPAGNPALALAGVHHAAHRAGRSTVVLMPYGERLRPLGPWWAQLIGESLGKPGVDGPVGVTPLAATGPADQHSLLQLLVEGPDDKLVVFVHAEGPDGPVVPAVAGFETAAGQSLGAILEAERLGTEYALAQAGRPSVGIRLAASDAASVGAFLLTYELTTVYWGRLLGVDPFGQPGVELGKQAARARLTGEPADLARAIDDHTNRTRPLSD